MLRGTLTMDRSQTLSAHIERCSSCAAARGWLERLLGATAIGPLAEPPGDVLERAFEIGASRPAFREAMRPGISLAQLVRDTFAQPIPLGVRGQAVAERRLLYRADDAELDLEISRADVAGSRFRVAGQVLVQGSAPVSELIAVLWANATSVSRASGDPMGMFVLRDVPPGTYRLELWIPAEGRIIRVDALVMGEAGIDQAPDRAPDEA